MSAVPLSAPPAPAGALCSLHPDRPAVAPCGRCGSFVCAEDARLVNNGVYCPTCAVRPEVDYLEAFRLKYWGRRDGWAYLVGAGSLVNLAGAAAAISAELAVVALAQLAIAAFCVCYFLGQRWTRVGLFFTPLVGLLALVVEAAANGASDFEVGAALGAGTVRAIIPMLVVTAIFNDTRNQLFFKVDVPKQKLQRAWNLYANNSIARTGFLLSFLGLAVPGVGAVALAVSIIGLRRVDPKANPPIGRKGQAIAGIVLGSIGLVVTSVMVGAAIIG